ncbi:MAG: hypothetical protein II882_05305 [Lachnospiraceae bacterium]|nr:hypothetical protein [Lachnospiraceae bacterium]
MFSKKNIRGRNRTILDATSLNATDICQLDDKVKNNDAVQMGLGEMQNLSLFPKVHVLILTGGIPTEEGIQVLYSNNQIRELVLDYEETDSDEDGIELEKITSLEYVLSRSNLNINQAEKPYSGITVQIINYYKNGKPQKITIPPSIDICRPRTGIFFSTESQTPAAVIIMRILNKIDSYLLENDYTISRYTTEFNEIAIIPICISEEMIARGFYKERKYISRKKRTADIRLHMDYDVFVRSDDNERCLLCYKMILNAGEYIEQKTQSFNALQFLTDVRDALSIDDAENAL